MVDIKYANAYCEVLEILKYISLEEYNKIPKNKIELFEANANPEYAFSYNPDKTLDEQEVSKTAKGIIAILFRDYWATEQQREKILAKQSYDREKLEEEKRKEYNPDNLFKDKKKENMALTVVENEKWYTKIVSFFKRVFSKSRGEE